MSVCGDILKPERHGMNVEASVADAASQLRGRTLHKRSSRASQASLPYLRGFGAWQKRSSGTSTRLGWINNELSSKSNKLTVLKSPLQYSLFSGTACTWDSESESQSTSASEALDSDSPASAPGGHSSGSSPESQAKDDSAWRFVPLEGITGALRKNQDDTRLSQTSAISLAWWSIQATIG